MKKSHTHQAGRQDRTRRFPRAPVIWVAAALLTLFLTASTFAYSVHLENSDRFCASCHTDPESAYVSRAQQPAVDLASVHAAKEVACIGCHSGAGLGGRIDAVMLGARDLTAYVRGQYPQPAVLTHPIPDTNCLKCHPDVLRSRAFDNHFHFLLPRWRAVAPKTAATCVSCHASHATDGESQIAWLNKPRTVVQCDACHRIAGED